MASRLDLDNELRRLLGSNNVYFQPPASLRMAYDAIRYELKDIDNIHASNIVYKHNVAYEITVIYRNPDSDLPFKIAQLPMCSHDRHYTADNLNHDVFTLYY